MSYIFAGPGHDASDAEPGHHDHHHQIAKDGPAHKDKDVVLSRPRASMDSANPSSSNLSAVTRKPPIIARASSFQNLRASAASPHPSSNGPRKLKRAPSTDQLLAVPRSEGNRKKDIRGSNKVIDMEVEEMRRRARRNYSFMHIKLGAVICVLSYKRDTPLSLTTVPDLDNFRFKTAPFEYRYQIWSFEEVANAMKKDLFKEIWRQKGVLIRELAVKAKFITPRKFLATSEAPSPSSSSTSLAGSEVTEGSKTHRRWPHIFRQRTNSHTPAPVSSSTTPTSRFQILEGDTSRMVLPPDTPLVSSPESESPPATTSSSSPRSSTPSSARANSMPFSLTRRASTSTSLSSPQLSKIIPTNRSSTDA